MSAETCPLCHGSGYERNADGEIEECSACTPERTYAEAVTSHDKVRAVIEQLGRIEKGIGGYTVTSHQLRKTGVTLHIGFDRAVPLEVSEVFVQMLCSAPGRYVNALRLLIGEEQVIG